nr:carboxypeptidase regulatory-like domain-containing protein [Candidatus Omnitrophota bacterium]
MKKNVRQLKAVTLIEVLVSTVIIAIVAISSYMGFFVLSGASDASHNRLNAVTLSQAALEEVRGVAQDNFANLPGIVFDDIDQNRYPGFHRAITIIPQGPNLVKADVTISWLNRQGQPQQFNNSAMISLPPEPFPGNIYGKITNSAGNAPISAAQIRVVNVANPTLTVTTTSDANGDYTFLDANGNMALKPGNWRLTVTCANFFTSDVIDVFNLAGGEDREVNVTLTPAGPGRITGSFRVQGAGVVSLETQLFENGRQVFYKITGAGGSFNFFPIVFTSDVQRCFTVNSINAFRDAVSQSYCRSFCDPDNLWGLSYNYHGWSSSVVGADGTTITCTNPWNGNAVSDRICLSAGETIDLGVIELERS